MLKLSIQSASPHKRTLSPHLRPESILRQNDFYLPGLRFQLFELLRSWIQLVPRLWRLEQQGVEGRFMCCRELQDQYVRCPRDGRLSVGAGRGSGTVRNSKCPTIAYHHRNQHPCPRKERFQQTSVVANPAHDPWMRIHLPGNLAVLEATSQKAKSQQDEAIRHRKEVGRCQRLEAAPG